MSCLESLSLPALCITNPPQENFGDLEVRLEAKTEKESHTPLGEAGLGRASFNEFFRRYKTDNMYCVSEVCSKQHMSMKLCFSTSNNIFM